MDHPIHAVVGKDPFLQGRAVAAIVSQLSGSPQRVDLDGEKVEIGDLLDELQSFAMFAGQKLVIVQDADGLLTRHRDALEKYAAQPSSTATLILRLASLPANQRIHKIISKTGKIHACDPPSKGEFPGWIVRHAREAHGVAITSPAAGLMLDLLGENPGRIDSELGRLALQCLGKPLTPEIIRASTSFQREQAMYEMTDELAQGNVPDALRRWRQMAQLDSAAEYKVVTWLTLMLEKMLTALQLLGEGAGEQQIAQQCRIYPFARAKGFVRSARQLGEEGLRRALAHLAELDHRGKTGAADMVSGVERFMLALYPRQ